MVVTSREGTALCQSFKQDFSFGLCQKFSTAVDLLSAYHQIFSFYIKIIWSLALFWYIQYQNTVFLHRVLLIQALIIRRTIKNYQKHLSTVSSNPTVENHCFMLPILGHKTLSKASHSCKSIVNWPGSTFPVSCIFLSSNCVWRGFW